MERVEKVIEQGGRLVLRTQLQSLKVMFIDPGGTTGLAWATLWSVKGALQSIKESLQTRQMRLTPVRSSTLDTRHLIEAMEIATMRDVYTLINQEGIDLVGIEDFQLFEHMPRSSQMKHSGLAPVRMITALNTMWFLASEVTELKPLVKQMPGERSIITDARLKQWGLWRTPKRSGGPHAMDALRHLIILARRIEQHDWRI